MDEIVVTGRVLVSEEDPRVEDDSEWVTFFL